MEEGRGEPPTSTASPSPTVSSSSNLRSPSIPDGCGGSRGGGGEGGGSVVPQGEGSGVCQVGKSEKGEKNKKRVVKNKLQVLKYCW